MARLTSPSLPGSWPGAGAACQIQHRSLSGCWGRVRSCPRWSSRSRCVAGPAVAGWGAAVAAVVFAAMW